MASLSFSIIRASTALLGVGGASSILALKRAPCFQQPLEPVRECLQHEHYFQPEPDFFRACLHPYDSALALSATPPAFGAVRWGAPRTRHRVVGRCKLDPGLKAPPGYNNSSQPNGEKWRETRSFQLEPCF